MNKNKKKETPGLLLLINARESWNLPPFRAPVLDAQRQRLVELAARTAQKAEPSDPFLYSKLKSHLSQGLDDPAEVLSTAQSRLRASGANV